MTTIRETLTTDHPFETSQLEDGVQGVIGADLARIDGPMKVAGLARYSAEYKIDNLAYGYLVLSTVPRATVTGLDEAQARRVPGVIDVFTDAKFLRHVMQGGEKESSQTSKEVAYAGQPLALVVAETYEAAREAGLLVRAIYQEQPAALIFEGRADEAERPVDGMGPAYGSQGDVDRAMREADVTLDVTYTTPSQNSAAMEPHATIAQWHGD